MSLSDGVSLDDKALLSYDIKTNEMYRRER